MAVHNYLFAQIDDLLHKRLEYVEKLSYVGYDLTVEPFLELVYTVVRVCLIIIERYALEIVDITVSFKSPVYHCPLHKIVRVKVSVVVCRCAVNIAGLTCILCCHCSRKRYLLSVLLTVAHKQVAVLRSQTLNELHEVFLSSDREAVSYACCLHERIKVVKSFSSAYLAGNALLGSFSYPVSPVRLEGRHKLVCRFTPDAPYHIVVPCLDSGELGCVVNMRKAHFFDKSSSFLFLLFKRRVPHELIAPVFFRKHLYSLKKIIHYLFVRPVANRAVRSVKKMHSEDRYLSGQYQAGADYLTLVIS